MSIDNILNRLEQANQQSTCYENRIRKLEQMGRDPRLIKDGIADVLRVVEGGARSFVIYGEPQSGKTEFMIALVCKLLDQGRKTIFLIMNDNTELETQNFERFHQAQEMNPTPLRDWQVVDMSAENLKVPRQRVIFCRKNARNLEKLIHVTRFMEDRIVIDDEADYATPNAKINKDDATAINNGVERLGDLGAGGTGTYIGVTATPARLDLNNTFLNESKNWIFLNSHDAYKGRQFFFPATAAEGSRSDYQLVKLPDDTDSPKLLRHSAFRFLLRVAILNSPAGSDVTAYSMLIHTAGKTNDHEKDNEDIQKILEVLSDQASSRFQQYVRELQEIAGELVQLHRSDFSPDDLVIFVLANIGRSQVLIINHKNDGGNVKRAGDPQALFTFAIGGNIVSRGLTFERLLTFYFSRNVKGRLQQNTYIQRARMFGNRPYSQYFELCVPESLFMDWATVFQDHELSLRLARAGVYQHIQSKGNQVVDRPAIDQKHITVEKSERAVGNIFQMSSALEHQILCHDPAKPLSALESLSQTGQISEWELPPSLLTYLREIAKPDESDVLIVFATATGGSKALQVIESYKDGDSETITRAKGGIVHAMLNKRIEYAQNRHFLLPIKNSRGEARWLYKSNIGHAILQNLRVQKPTV